MRNRLVSIEYHADRCVLTVNFEMYTVNLPDDWADALMRRLSIELDEPVISEWEEAQDRKPFCEVVDTGEYGFGISIPSHEAPAASVNSFGVLFEIDRATAREMLHQIKALMFAD